MLGARNYLFPLYASLATPGWLRLLGAKVATTPRFRRYC